MKLFSFTLTLLGLLAIAPAALAQSAAPEGLSGDANSNEIFSGSGVGLYDLIHQVSGNGVSSADFTRQQQRRIPTAVDDFRQRQQEAIRQAAEADSAPVTDETVTTE